MVCHVCGRVVGESHKFCEFCGARRPSGFERPDEPENPPAALPDGSDIFYEEIREDSFYAPEPRAEEPPRAAAAPPPAPVVPAALHPAEAEPAAPGETPSPIRAVESPEPYGAFAPPSPELNPSCALPSVPDVTEASAQAPRGLEDPSPAAVIQVKSSEKALSLAQFWVMELVGLIPVVNLVVFFIFAMRGKGNQNRTRLAQAKLLTMMLVTIAMLIGALTVIVLLSFEVIPPIRIEWPWA